MAQLSCIHARLYAGAEESTLAHSGIATAVNRAMVCPLALFPDQAVTVDHPHLTAASVCALRGPLPCTAIAAFEPRDALALIDVLRGDRPPGSSLRADDLDLFVGLGRSLSRSLVAALSGQQPGQIKGGPARLVEDTLWGVVVGTHAPPDTAVISAEVELRFPKRAIAFATYLLLEPKRLEGLLAELPELRTTGLPQAQDPIRAT